MLIFILWLHLQTTFFEIFVFLLCQYYEAIINLQWKNLLNSNEQNNNFWISKHSFLTNIKIILIIYFLLFIFHVGIFTLINIYNGVNILIKHIPIFIYIPWGFIIHIIFNFTPPENKKQTYHFFIFIKKKKNIGSQKKKKN